MDLCGDVGMPCDGRYFLSHTQAWHGGGEAQKTKTLAVAQKEGDNSKMKARTGEESLAADLLLTLK